MIPIGQAAAEGLDRAAGPPGKIGWAARRAALPELGIIEHRRIAGIVSGSPGKFLGQPATAPAKRGPGAFRGLKPARGERSTALCPPDMRP